MAISDAKAVFGLSAIGTGTRPWISQTATIGLTQTGVPLVNATIAFAAELYLQGGDTATLDLSDFTTTIDTAAAVQASSTLTLTGNAVADETVTIGDITYTWKASVSTTANQVKIGATASDSLDNLITAINAGAGSGTVYGSATVANPKATAAAGAGDTMIATAVAIGELGNGVVTTETMTNGSWGAAAMSGGLNANEWIGASLDFEGEAFSNATVVYGLIIYVEEGDIAIIDSDEVQFAEAQEGGRVVCANQSGIASLNGEVITFSNAQQSKLKIAVLAS